MINIDLEREYLMNDKLAKEAEWEEREHFYEIERNKQLPAIIRVMIPNFKIKKDEVKSVQR